MAKKEKTIKNEKSHTFKVITYSDGSVSMQRENDGFTALELLGYTAHIQLDIQKRLAEFSEPDSVEKTIIIRKTK
jgi:muramoyltetrapeptide carboxypeptidase LdcA involved in peptidoglycan recycling